MSSREVALNLCERHYRIMPSYGHFFFSEVKQQPEFTEKGYPRSQNLIRLRFTGEIFNVYIYWRSHWLNEWSLLNSESL